MLIRRFRLGDELDLFQVYYSAIHLVANRDYTPEQIKAWAPVDLDMILWAKRMRGINPFVAEIDGKPVGYADVQLTGYVDHFFVSGYQPRQGIGRQLMEALHVEAASLGLSEMTSDVSRTAQPFFAKFGFTVIEQRQPELRGVVIPNALMRKTLS